jgi:hypothetical protein
MQWSFIKEGVNMKSVTYFDAILAQSNASIPHRREEREEREGMLEATSRVKSNQWKYPFLLRGSRAKKKTENKKKKRKTCRPSSRKRNQPSKKSNNRSLYST